MGNEWLKPVLAKGVSMWLMLRLKNAPTEEEIKATLEAWYQVLNQSQSWEQEKDQARLEKAFFLCAEQCDWFPTPRDFLAMLPPRPIERPAVIHKSLEQQIQEQQQAQANLAKIRKMLRGAICVIPSQN